VLEMTNTTTIDSTGASVGTEAPVLVEERMHWDRRRGLHPFARVLMAIAALSLGTLLSVPIWRIDLRAPQYPEGLAITISHDRFEGDIQKINGLNHYIGMATIDNSMFPEFTIMRYAFYLLIGWGLVAAIIGKRGALLSWLFSLFAFVIWAMWDMYAWGYKYGHNLNPHAAIQVEGMAYQPPLIGHKKLLNFDAWSTPDQGGWVLFAVISVVGLIFLHDHWVQHRAKKKARTASA
jgi:copper chaperone NosL